MAELAARATMSVAGPGRYELAGEATYETVSKLFADTRSLFQGAGPFAIDLSSVSEIDSAGLALLVEWVRRARTRSAAIRFEKAPAKLAALARIGDLSELLSFG